MPQVTVNIAALAIAAIYYLYRDGYIAQVRRQQTFRERIAYMLWTAAQNVA